MVEGAFISPLEIQEMQQALWSLVKLFCYLLLAPFYLALAFYAGCYVYAVYKIGRAIFRYLVTLPYIGPTLRWLLMLKEHK